MFDKADFAGGWLFFALLVYFYFYEEWIFVQIFFFRSFLKVQTQ